MTVFNEQLTKEHWFTFSLPDQLSNIGSEVYRATKWKQKEPEKSLYAFQGALELIDMSLQDQKYHRRGALTELCRLREVLADYFAGSNLYQSNDEQINKYFYQVNYKST